MPGPAAPLSSRSAVDPGFCAHTQVRRHNGWLWPRENGTRRRTRRRAPRVTSKQMRNLSTYPQGAQMRIAKRNVRSGKKCPQGAADNRSVARETSDVVGAAKMCRQLSAATKRRAQSAPESHVVSRETHAARTIAGGWGCPNSPERICQKKTPTHYSSMAVITFAYPTKRPASKWNRVFSRGGSGAASNVRVVGSRRENIHDAVEILDAGKLDAYLALSDAQRDLDIGIEAVG